eukprot:565145-Prorocentrum_minimum.AAC.1
MFTIPTPPSLDPETLQQESHAESPLRRELDRVSAAPRTGLGLFRLDRVSAAPRTGLGLFRLGRVSAAPRTGLGLFRLDRVSAAPRTGLGLFRLDCLGQSLRRGENWTDGGTRRVERQAGGVAGIGGGGDERHTLVRPIAAQCGRPHQQPRIESVHVRVAHRASRPILRRQAAGTIARVSQSRVSDGRRRNRARQTRGAE